MKGKTQFLTWGVVVIFLIGVILLILGEYDVLFKIFPSLGEKSPLSSILRSIGIAFIGSGVFSGIIRSATYTDIFTNAIGETIWSKKYIQKRVDKQEVWSMVSKMIYNEKFPAISDELENIITKVYFPTSYNFYIEDYDINMNIFNIDGNEDFWQQEETIKMTLHPVNPQQEIDYTMGGDIDKPIDNRIIDITSCEFTSLCINNVPQKISVDESLSNDKRNIHIVKLKLSGAEKYRIEVVKSKKVYKKTNPDKRFFGKNIVKNLRVTFITNASMEVGFHKMGTIKEFEKEVDQLNGDVKIETWAYRGITLPQQGFIAILKSK